MNLLEHRRMMMMFMGAIPMIGDFTKYEKKTVSFPNASDVSSWDNGAIVSCSFEPKLIVFYGGSSVSSNIISGVFILTYNSESINVGGVKARTSGGALTQYVMYLNATASAGRFKYENGTFYACRVASGVYWSNSDTYTFEMYA